LIKALLFENKSQRGRRSPVAIADESNNGRAIAIASFYRMFVGHVEDGVTGQEIALPACSRARSNGPVEEGRG
jgi:hypothetical protein